MTTAKIRYVGLKGCETAFNDVTGITWSQGDVASVDTKHVVAMLKHPDVFELADEPASLAMARQPAPLLPPLTLALTAPPVQAQAIKSLGGEVVSLAGMDADALRNLATDQGVKVHHLARAPKIIEVLMTALPLGE